MITALYKRGDYVDISDNQANANSKLGHPFSKMMRSYPASIYTPSPIAQMYKEYIFHWVSKVTCALFIPGYLNLKVSKLRYVKVSLIVLLFVPPQSISGPKKANCQELELKLNFLFDFCF